MLNKFTFFIAVAFFALSSCTEQKQEYTIVFYNVENLFDTIDNPHKWDNDFTPDGKLQFSSERYINKLDKISKVLSSIDSMQLPSVIGLCEVENHRVLKDLILQESLKKGNYGVAHTESPDKRGIDCALLYKKSDFKYLKHDVIGIQFPWKPEYKTRDILHVQGMIGKDTLHIFINHWPSRRGGQEKSEKNRVFVAKQLKLAVDQLQAKNKEAKIIIMGDCNDEPDNKAVAETLAANNDKTSQNPSQLYNLMYDLDMEGKGTYNYKGNWNMLDHLIVSKSFFNNKNGLYTSYNSGRIFSEEWICYKNKAGTLVPSRTYGGSKYYGGFSDHFPVYFQIHK